MDGKYLAEIILTTLVLVLAPGANAEISINEIMYAPNGNWGGENNEWIELFNNASSDTSISNWTIDGKTIPDAIIPTKGYLILAKNSTKFLEVYGLASLRVPFTLSNSGKIVYLRTADNSTSDFFDYTNYASSDLAKNNNQTLERNLLGWFESTATGGTPGAQNSIFSYSAPPAQTGNETGNETENTAENITENTPRASTPTNATEEETNPETNPETNIPAQQNPESNTPARIEILGAPDTMNFGGYSTVRAKFSTGDFDFQKVRFVAYIYKPSWIARDINTNETTLRNSPYNSNAAAEVLELASNETYYLVLPLFLKCSAEGYSNTTHTARVRAYSFENSEWTALAESDREIVVSGENDNCKKEKENTKSSANSSSAPEKCANATKIIREPELEINVTHLEVIFGNENFTTAVYIKNNGETLRDIEIYSYIYEHGTIISSGFDGERWGNARTANSKKVSLEAGNSTVIELVARAKENTTAEKYTYKVRFDDLADDKKSEERIYLIELKARDINYTDSQKNGTFSNSTEKENKITGAVLLKSAETKKLSLLDRIIYKIKSWLM